MYALWASMHGLFEFNTNSEANTQIVKTPDVDFSPHLPAGRRYATISRRRLVGNHKASGLSQREKHWGNGTYSEVE